MNRSLVSWLRCPSGCSAPLTLESGASNSEQIETGALRCGGCDRAYPIREGIARMLPDGLSDREVEDAGRQTLTADSLRDDAITQKRREMHARDLQVDDYERMWYLNLFGLLEIPATLLHLSLASDHLLLEAGCGTGRMTRDFAARCARLISVDYSWESLRVCAAKLRRAGVRNVDLLQADICRLPFRSGLFDRVVSCQVLEHVPTAPSRAAAVDELARVLQPGGNLAISAYQYSLWTRLFGEKEGEHNGGIYFYRFERSELCALLSRAFTVEAVTGALVYHYIARCRKGDA